MSGRPSSGAASPERERRSARWLATPFIFMILLVVLVLALALSLVRPWEGDGAFERTEPPAATARP